MTHPNITPGPWHYTKGVSPAVNAQQERHTLHIAKTIYGTHGEALANARAIAALPDLLSALETLLAVSQSALPQNADHEGLKNCEALANARAALTAAGYQF